MMGAMQKYEKIEEQVQDVDIEEAEGKEEDGGGGGMLWVGALAPQRTSGVLQPRTYTVASSDVQATEAEEESTARKAEIQRTRVVSRVLYWAVIALHLILHPVGYYFVYKPLPGNRTGLIATMYICGALSLALYVWLSSSNPGVIPVNSRYAIRRMYPSARTCVTCKLVRPLRSKHCKICGVCVARMDHHCIWLGNCVGASNQLAFVLFLALEAAHLGVALIVLFSHIWAVRKQYYLLSKGIGTMIALLLQGGPTAVFTKYSQLPLSVFIVAVILPLWLLVFSLFIGQVYGVSTNMLVNESINRHRYTHLRQRNPFTKGVVENWKELVQFTTATTKDLVRQSWRYDECVPLNALSVCAHSV